MPFIKLKRPCYVDGSNVKSGATVEASEEAAFYLVSSGSADRAEAPKQAPEPAPAPEKPKRGRPKKVAE